jgi:hypothetical protein
MSERNFFPNLKDYIQQVDQFLKYNICTFHNILKNSVLHSVNQEVELEKMDADDTYNIGH